MSRRRFYVPAERIHKGIAELSEDQAHRLRDVLRLRSNREIEIFDGEGNTYIGRLGFEDDSSLVLDLQPVTHEESSRFALVVAPAIIKPARFEWMLEKSTELGADEFIPLITRYSDTHVTKGNACTRTERWQRIIRQACEQCGRAVIPRLQSPLKFLDFLQLQSLSGFTRLLCHQDADVPLTRTCFSRPVVLCIGPEGGWESREIDAAQEAGFELVSLGRNTLRAETSVIAAITLLRIAV